VNIVSCSRTQLQKRDMMPDKPHYTLIEMSLEKYSWFVSSALNNFVRTPEHKSASSALLNTQPWNRRRGSGASSCTADTLISAGLIASFVQIFVANYVLPARNSKSDVQF
jgi:hypothetical protein